MKKYFFIAFALCFMVSCSHLSKSVAKTLYNIAYELPADNEAISSSLRNFWNDYVNDVQAEIKKDVNNELKNRVYKPSDEFLNKYGVIVENNNVKVTGVVTVNDNKISADFVNQNPKFNFVHVTANVYTFKCDVLALPELIKIDGIRYIEIDQKSQLHQN